jgi:hypothetical protein
MLHGEPVPAAAHDQDGTTGNHLSVISRKYLICVRQHTGHALRPQAPIGAALLAIKNEKTQIRLEID